MNACLEGCLLGQAVGDALGFIVEGYPAKDCEIYYSTIIKDQKIPTNNRLPMFRFGQYSDDTQLAREFLIAFKQTHNNTKALVPVFATRIAMMFQPGAYRIVGYGHQTEKAAHNIRKGSSLINTTGNGNGSAMRSVPIGVVLQNLDWRYTVTLAREASATTHASPRCLDGAAIIALAGRYAAHKNEFRTSEFLSKVSRGASTKEMQDGLKLVYNLVMRNAEPLEARDNIVSAAREFKEAEWPDGISHGVFQTVMYSIYCVCRHNNNYTEAIGCAIRGGGDTDTTAAIVGGIIGTRIGIQHMPRQWVDAVHDKNMYTNKDEWGVQELQELVASIVYPSSEI